MQPLCVLAARVPLPIGFDNNHDDDINSFRSDGLTCLEADLQQLRSLGGAVLQGVLQHGLEGCLLAVGVVTQEAEARVQVIHTVLNGSTTQAPPAPCLHHQN